MGLFDRKPAWQSMVASKAKAAVARITDSAELAKVARQEPLDQARIMAIYKLEDQQVIADVALNDRNIYVRTSAIDKLNLVETLVTIAQRDRDELVRAHALRRLEKVDRHAAAAVQPDANVNQNLMSMVRADGDLFDRPASILDKYRAALRYLENCSVFDEAAFREFNRITGNRFAEADIQSQLRNAGLMLKGMEDLRELLLSSTMEAIGAFEEMERQGIDLSKFDV